VTRLSLVAMRCEGADQNRTGESDRSGLGRFSLQTGGFLGGDGAAREIVTRPGGRFVTSVLALVLLALSLAGGARAALEEGAPASASGGTAPSSSAHLSVWTRVADCETGDGDGRPPYRAVWSYNGRSGFDGGLQFHPDTWRRAKALRSVRGVAYRYSFAYLAPAWVQIRVADAWLAVTSWKQWPACSRKLGLR